MRRRSLGAMLATGCVAALAVAASSAGAAVTIGQTGPPSGLCNPNQDWAQQLVSSGTPYIVPSIPPATSLSIISWSHQADATPNEQLKLKVYRPVSGLTYNVVGQDLRSLTPSALNTFQVSIPVAPGDILGLTSPPSTPAVGCGTGAFGETDLESFSDGGLGENVTFFTTAAKRLNVSAVVEPTNTFTLGAVTRNTKKGTATLAVGVPNPGDLTATGSGVQASRATEAKSVLSAGTVALVIKATGKKLKKLRRKGKVTVALSIAYTPTNGSATTQSTQVTLKKKK